MKAPTIFPGIVYKVIVQTRLPDGVDRDGRPKFFLGTLLKQSGEFLKKRDMTAWLNKTKLIEDDRAHLVTVISEKWQYHFVANRENQPFGFFYNGRYAA